MKVLKRRITFWDIILNGTKTAFNIIIKIVLVCATLTGFLQFAGISISFKALVLGTSSLIIYFPIISYIIGKSCYIPDIFNTDDSDDGNYRAEISSASRLAEACDLTKPYYGKEYVPPSQAEQWRQKNTKAFVDILNKEGVLIASFGIILPNETFFRSFINGQTSDTLLRGEDVCSFTKTKKSSQLYISGVLVRDPERTIGKLRAKVMVWTMLQFYKKFYGLKKARDLYAVAVNKKSSTILKRMGFILKTEGKNRLDKCSLFTLRLNKEEWERMVNRVGDFSEMCTLDF